MTHAVAFEVALRADAVESGPALSTALAEILADLEEWTEVLAISGSLLADQPHRLAAMRLQVQALTGLGRNVEADDARRGFCARFPQVQSLRMDLAWLLADSGQLAEALTEFDRASTEDPQNVGAECGRVRTLARLGRTDEANAAAERAVERWPLDVDPAMELVWIQLDADRTSDALILVDRALKLDPYHQYALAWRVILLRRLARWPAAEGAAAEAVARLPDLNSVLFDYLDLLERRGHSGEVDGVLRQKLQQRPGDIWLLMRVIEVHRRRGRYTEILAVLDDLGSRYDTSTAASWRAYALTSLRCFAESESVLTRALERFGRQRTLLVDLTTVYECTGRLEAAVDIYREILETNPDDITASSWWGYDLRELDRLDEAEEIARRDCARRPYVAVYRAQLGWTLEAKGQYEDARLTFVDAQALDPDDQWLVIGEIRMLRQLRRLADAERRSREGVVRWPESDDVRIELARVLDEMNRYEDALDECDVVLRADAYSGECTEAKSAVLRSMHRFDEAERLVRQLVGRLPHRQSAWVELAWIQRDRKQYSAAETTFTKLLRDAEAPSEVADARCGLGWTALDQRRSDDAQTHFRAALAVQSDSTMARMGLAWALVRRNDRHVDAEAEQLCLAVLARRPLHHEAHTCLGVLNFQRGQLSVAGYHLRRAVEIDPHHGSHVDLGSFLAKLERLDDAEAALRRALEVDPDDAQAHVELGNVFLQRSASASEGDGRYATQAAYHFRQARLTQPESGAASLGLALALAVGGPGGLVAAEDVLRRALALPVGDVPRGHLTLALARLMLQQAGLTQRPEMYEEALDVAVDAIREAPNDPHPYFVAGLAEFKLGESEASLYLRPWHRHRARNYLKQCTGCDPGYIEARRTLRALDRATRLARPAAAGSAILGALATAVLITVWVGLLTHNSAVNATMVVVLTPIMIGLVGLSTVLPSIVRLRLPGGVEADLYASLSQISAGPTGDEISGPGRLSVNQAWFPVSAGPVGRQPRLQ